MQLEPELFDREGLHEEIDARIKPAVVHDPVSRVASRIENLQVWDALTSFVAELAAVDAGQADIGEEQNDFRMLV